MVFIEIADSITSGANIEVDIKGKSAKLYSLQYGCDKSKISIDFKNVVDDRILNEIHKKSSLSAINVNYNNKV